jgi:transposase
MSRKQFSLEFKEQAVKLALSGEKSKSQTARDLGISNNVLHRWIGLYGPPAPVVAPPVEQPESAEMKRLRKALARAEMERDILKKAIGIFSEAQ